MKNIEAFELSQYGIRTMIPHNSWMAPHSILHTVKFGDCSNAD